MRSDDVQLQKALYASLQQAQRSAGADEAGRQASSSSGPTAGRRAGVPQPRPSGFGGGQEPGYPAPLRRTPQGGHSRGRNRGNPPQQQQLMPPPSAAAAFAQQGNSFGHVNSLQRNGLIPAEPSAASREAIRARRESRVAPPPTYPAASSSPVRRRGAGRSGLAGQELSSANIVDRVTVHSDRQAIVDAISDGHGLYGQTKPAAFKAQATSTPSAPSIQQQAGWRRHQGSGMFSCGEEGGLSEGYVESVSKGCATSIIHEPRDSKAAEAIRNGNFRLMMQFKCAHAAPASGNRPGFTLLLATRSSGGTESVEGTTLAVDCVDRCWTLECHTASIGRQSQFHDRDLRPGVLHSIRVEVMDGIEVSLFCGDRQIIPWRSLPGGARICGPIGLRVDASRLEWRKWKVESHRGASQPQGTIDNVPRANEAYSGNDASLAEAIERDVMERDLGITFDDIASLYIAKRTLNEAVTLPLIIPEYFTGIREPWKGVLLFGPPGTGKTLLAKAVASMNNVKFFNCSASTLTSKYRGESEKLVRELFQMARHYAPSIIFFDEVDALVSPRGAEGEHEASRRFKAELLSQMDGIGSVGHDGRNVMVLATTNCPWDLDEAIRRRLEKRIYIPLPDLASRSSMFAIHMKGVACDSTCDFEELAVLTDGYSGADVKIACRDASLMPMRRLVADRSPQEIVALKASGQLDVSLTQEDFKTALANMKPSVALCDVKKYEDWDREFASA